MTLEQVRNLLDLIFRIKCSDLSSEDMSVVTLIIEEKIERYLLND